MMKTTRILLTVAIAMLMTVPLSAQQKKKGGGRLSAPARALARIDKLHKAMEGIDLTDEQEQAVKKIHEELGPKMKEMLDALKEVLTDQQREAVEKAADDAKAAGKKGWAFFKAVDAAVKPTDEQKKKLNEIGKKLADLNKAVTKKIMAILTDEQKQILRKKMAPQRRRGGKRGKKKNG